MNDRDNVATTEPEQAHEGPFGVAPVDPLIYRKTDDAPELRAAAAAVPRTQPREATPPPPQRPAAIDHDDWTPGGTAAHELPPGTSRTASSTVFTVIAVVIPLGLLAGAIYLGLHLASGL